MGKSGLKKFLLVFCIIMMLLPQLGTAYAYENEADLFMFDATYDKADKMFQYINQYRKEFGLPEGSVLYLGDSINSYLLQEGALKASEVKYYPVVDETNKVWGIVLSVNDIDSGKTFINYSDMLVDEINECFQEGEAVCIIVEESESIYVKSSTNMIQAFDFSSENKYQKSTISKLSEESISNVIKYSEIEKKRAINSTIEMGSSTMAANTNKLLNVRKIRQDVGSKYCWACTAVSLGQYKKPNIVLDAREIAIKYTGNTNTGESIGVQSMVLSMEYNYIATRTNGNPTFSTIKSNIDSNNPMSTSVLYVTSGAHAILINGYSTSTSAYFVNAMDPLTGTYRVLDTTSASSSSKMVYIDPSKGIKANPRWWII